MTFGEFAFIIGYIVVGIAFAAGCDRWMPHYDEQNELPPAILVVAWPAFGFMGAVFGALVGGAWLLNSAVRRIFGRKTTLASERERGHLLEQSEREYEAAIASELDREVPR